MTHWPAATIQAVYHLKRKPPGRSTTNMIGTCPCLKSAGFALICCPVQP